MNASNSRFAENRNRRGHNGATDGCIESNSLTPYDYIIDLVHAEVRSDEQTDSIQMKSKRMFLLLDGHFHFNLINYDSIQLNVAHSKHSLIRWQLKWANWTERATDVLRKHEQNEQQITVNEKKKWKKNSYRAARSVVFYLWFFFCCRRQTLHAIIVSDLIAAAAQVKNRKIDHCTGRNGGEEIARKTATWNTCSSGAMPHIWQCPLRSSDSSIVFFLDAISRSLSLPIFLAFMQSTHLHESIAPWKCTRTVHRKAKLTAWLNSFMRIH